MFLRAIAIAGLACGLAFADEPLVEFNTDFPGGNLLVQANEGKSPVVAPDLRGGRDWFYWYFEAKASKPGRVTFVFPEKVAGFKNGAIGNQGPAVSTDGGKTWAWAGRENVRENAFFHDFSKAGETIRYAVTIPYTESNLSQFLEKQAGNSHLQTGVLTQSNEGRDVELLEIGKRGDGRRPVIVTARHHAVETMASYVLEGFLAEAMSDSDAGKAFREKFYLIAIPLVDKDGVEKGDQGKNRRPHDHNRDYNLKSIYPEIQAIKKLSDDHKFEFALDFHCPTLVMPDHQVIYFVGAQRIPAHNLENVKAFAKWIKEGLPEGAPPGPLVWLRDEKAFSPKSSRFFGFQKQAVMSATLEFPFAPPGRKTDVESCRRYGEVILQAFVQTEFIE